MTSTTAEAHNLNGKKSFSNRRYDEAIDHYTKAIKSCPSVKYFQNRAICHFLLNSFQKSEEDCKRALELSPNEIKPLYFLGNVYLRTNRFNEAISCFTKALYHNSNISNAPEIENALKKARHLKYEDDESKRICQEIEFHDYISLLIEKDQEENLDNEEIVKKGEMAKQRLNEITSTTAEKRQNREIPEFLCGKITLELMKDPVIVPSGITYDREEIVQHLRRIGHFDPVTRKPLIEKDIIPNYALKEAIEKFLEDNPWAKYEPGTD